MAVFMLTADDQDRLKEARRLATANPISLDLVAQIAATATTDSSGLLRGDRPNSAPRPQEVRLALGWLVALSCEEQPIGLCLHLSMSTPTPTKTAPSPEALQMVLDVLGGSPVKRWIEEFKVDGVAAGWALNAIIALQRPQ